MNKGRRSSGGRAARREARTTQQIEFSKYIERKIPNFEVLNTEALEVIEDSAEIILAEIGIKFPDNEYSTDAKFKLDLKAEYENITFALKLL